MPSKPAPVESGEAVFVFNLTLSPFFQTTTEITEMKGVDFFSCSFDRVHVSLPCKVNHDKQPTKCRWFT